MRVLVDSSVWIEYFKKGTASDKLDDLIDLNVIYINDLILCELLPFIKVSKHPKLSNIFSYITKLDLPIDWPELMEMQTKALKKGFNNIGIPDLIIAQQAIQSQALLYSFDKHFQHLSKWTPLKLFV